MSASAFDSTAPASGDLVEQKASINEARLFGQTAPGKPNRCATPPPFHARSALPARNNIFFTISCTVSVAKAIFPLDERRATGKSENTPSQETPEPRGSELLFRSSTHELSL
jgi:hypothetical protein